MRGTASREAAQRLIDAAKTKPRFKYTYMGETVRDRAVSGWRKEIENDPLTNLTAVEVPTLVLYGANDAVVPVAYSVERLKTVASQMPKMDVHVVAGADQCDADVGRREDVARSEARRDRTRGLARIYRRAGGLAGRARFYGALTRTNGGDGGR